MYLLLLKKKEKHALTLYYVVSMFFILSKQRFLLLHQVSGHELPQFYLDRLMVCYGHRHNGLECHHLPFVYVSTVSLLFTCCYTVAICSTAFDFGHTPFSIFYKAFYF